VLCPAVLCPAVLCPALPCCALPCCALPCCAVLCAGERLHVLDLDNDGLITEKELSDALQFLKANLDDEDLKALLDK
jgi:hypothetical protein